MNNKTVLITGATGGIGKQTAIALAKLGFTVVITGRNKTNGLQAVEDIKNISQNKNIDLIIGDLSVLEGVKSIATQFQKKYRHLSFVSYHILK